MFFAVVLNKMATNVDDTVNQRIMMCDVINMKHSISFDGQNDEVRSVSFFNNSKCILIPRFKLKDCTTKLENETLGQSLMLEILFAFGFAMTGFLINKVGKFPILCEFFLNEK